MIRETHFPGRTSFSIEGAWLQANVTTRQEFNLAKSEITKKVYQHMTLRTKTLVLALMCKGEEV